MNINDEKKFYKVLHQEMESNWKYLLDDYHIVPLVSGFENQLDRFIVIGVPFYLQRYCYETETDVERDVPKWDDFGRVITSFALEGSLTEYVKDSHLVYLKGNHQGFANDAKNIDMSAVFSTDRMGSNRRIYKLMERLITATGKYLSVVRFDGNNMANVITKYAMNLDIIPDLSKERKYVGMYKSDYLKVIYDINDSLIQYYKRLHLWEIDDLYYALSDSEHFLQQFTNTEEYTNVKLYLDIFRPFYEEMIEILIRFGNNRAIRENTSDGFLEKIEKIYNRAKSNPNDYLISILGLFKEYQDLEIPTSIQSVPLFLMRVNLKEGGTTNGCI